MRTEISRFVDPADIEGFVSAALGMLGNPTMLAPMGPNGRAYAERASGRD
mgnify:CR=1 FL=1